MSRLILWMVAVCLLVAMCGGCEPNVSHLLTLHIEQQSEGRGVYKIGYKIYATKRDCNFVAKGLNQKKPTIWITNQKYSFTLKYARCDSLPSNPSRDERKRLNVEFKKYFLRELP